MLSDIETSIILNAIHNNYDFYTLPYKQRKNKEGSFFKSKINQDVKEYHIYVQNKEFYDSLWLILKLTNVLEFCFSDSNGCYKISFPKSIITPIKMYFNNEINDIGFIKNYPNPEDKICFQYKNGTLKFLKEKAYFLVGQNFFAYKNGNIQFKCNITPYAKDILCLILPELEKM